MPSYLHPGVYIEEIPSGVKPIEGVPTSTAAFIGYTTKGPLAEPTQIFKWETYDDQFGGRRDTGKSLQGDPMGFAVYNFFLNGGTTAYIARLAQEGTTGSAAGFLINPADAQQILKFTAVNPGDWGAALRLEFTAKKDFPDLFVLKVGVADAEGKLKVLETFTDLTVADDQAADYIEGQVNGVSQLIKVEVQDIAPYLLGVSISQDLSAVTDFSVLNDKTMTVTVDGTARTVGFGADDFDDQSTLTDVAGRIQELVRGALQAPAVANFTCTVSDHQLSLTSGSRLPTSAVVVTGPGDATDAASELLLGLAQDGTERTGQQSLNLLLSGVPGAVSLSGGSNGNPPDLEAYNNIFALLEKYRDISIICLPGQTWDTSGEQAIIDAAVAHAEKMKNRMVIIDPPVNKELTTEKAVTDLGFKPKTYAVVYYPWAKVANPFYNAETNPGVPKTLLVGASALAAGMWAKIDARRGVWKAPAGIETSLLGVAGLQYEIEDGEQDQLNPWGINCLRQMPGYGPVIWGTRTLATKADPEWRYVPVRRTAIMIEQSIYNGIQWAVFEPNDHNLWASLRTNIGAFMDGLYRAGAFQGRTASEAYFVRCGKGDTMTQDDIDRGMVIVIVGFAPLKPAEFVIVRIQQKVAQQ
ncbi:MAG: phage tail sheath subtilisin-like domain-containing protein [Desulfobacca sp.]|nr:phage tail sheath subtilisin-like domain-containing protein [Desulfobacca sp.]